MFLCFTDMQFMIPVVEIPRVIGKPPDQVGAFAALAGVAAGVRWLGKSYPVFCV